MKTTTSKSSHVKPSQIFNQALDAMKCNFIPEAIHLFNMYLLFEPMDKSARLKKALCFLYNGQGQKALETMNDVLQEDLSNYETYVSLAEYYCADFEFEMAKIMLDKAMSLATNDAEKSEIFSMFSELSYCSKQMQNALTYVESSIILQPFRAEYLFQRALIELADNKITEAKRDFDIAVQINPEYAEAYRERARCWMLMNKVDNGLRDIRKAQDIEINRCRRFAAVNF